MKLDTQAEKAKVYPTALDILAELNINLKTDPFMIVQPFDDGHVIIFEVLDEEGERTVKQKVYDGCVVLPKKEGTLDIFI